MNRIDTVGLRNRAMRPYSSARAVWAGRDDEPAWSRSNAFGDDGPQGRGGVSPAAYGWPEPARRRRARFRRGRGCLDRSETRCFEQPAHRVALVEAVFDREEAPGTSRSRAPATIVASATGRSRRRERAVRLEPQVAVRRCGRSARCRADWRRSRRSDPAHACVPIRAQESHVADGERAALPRATSSASGATSSPGPRPAAARGQRSAIAPDPVPRSSTRSPRSTEGVRARPRPASRFRARISTPASREIETQNRGAGQIGDRLAVAPALREREERLGRVARQRIARVRHQPRAIAAQHVREETRASTARARVSSAPRTLGNARAHSAASETKRRNGRP